MPSSLLRHSLLHVGSGSECQWRDVQNWGETFFSTEIFYTEMLANLDK